MSRIGRRPLVLPKGVSLSQKAGTVGLKGPKGELTRAMPRLTLKVEAHGAGERATTTGERSKHGLVRAPRQNAEGGTDGGPAS